MRYKVPPPIGDGSHVVAVVHWKDAQIDNGDSKTEQEAQAFGLIEGLAAGILVCRDEEKIVLANDYFPEHGTYRGLRSYPMKSVLSVREGPGRAKAT